MTFPIIFRNRPYRRWRIPSALTGLWALTLGFAAVPARPAVAAEGSPIGWASQNGGTTGGAGGTTQKVTSASALSSALSSSSKLTIELSGMINVSGWLTVKSDKTIVGVGEGAGISGGGLSLRGVKNVIIRNLAFDGAPIDAISVESGTTNVWIDHNDLANASDGLIDIKTGSDFITVSWNKFHNHDKTTLVGHADDNGSQDTGHLRVTYHHNWFDATTQRHPLVRFGNPVHVYNNYYVGNSGYGVLSLCNAGVLVERNFFDGIAKPVVTSHTGSPSGNAKLVDNHLVSSGSEAPRNPSSVQSIPYSYSPDAAADVKSIVMSEAGTGKIG